MYNAFGGIAISSSLIFSILSSNILWTSESSLGIVCLQPTKQRGEGRYDTSSRYKMPVLRFVRHRRRLATRRSPGHFQISRTAGKPAEVPDLPPLRSSAVPVCGRTSPFPAGKKITLQLRRMEYYEKRTQSANIFPAPVANLSIRHAKPTAVSAAVGFVVSALPVQ